MCFDIGSQHLGAGAKTHLQSRVKKVTPHTVFAGQHGWLAICFLFRAHTAIKLTIICAWLAPLLYSQAARARSPLSSTEPPVPEEHVRKIRHCNPPPLFFLFFCFHKTVPKYEGLVEDVVTKGVPNYGGPENRTLENGAKISWFGMRFSPSTVAVQWV